MDSTNSLGSDTGDFTVFVERSRVQMHRWAYLVCGDWTRAEDIVQSVLMRLYPRWDRIQRNETAHAYVRRAVVNAAIDDQRRWARLMRMESTVRPGREAVDRGAVDDRLGGDLIAAMDGLGSRQRAVLVLRYIEDLSIEETAHILGISPGTVKSQAARGLASLRKDLSVYRTERNKP